MSSGNAFWRYDTEAKAWYFAPEMRANGPYKRQIRVEAIIDIGHDGTLAGVEIIDGNCPGPHMREGK